MLVGLLTGGIAEYVGASRSSHSSLQSPGTQRLSTYWSMRIRRWESLILQEANRRSLDPDFLAALVWMESRGDAKAIGPTGSVGLMQVMPKEEGFSWRPSKEVLLDPAMNLFWGTRTISIIIKQADGDIFNALAAYNAGWEKVAHNRPRYYAMTILRDYANAIAVRCGIGGRWIAYYAVRSPYIHGPIWIADSARQDVYFFGQANRLLEGTVLIPDVSPTSVVAGFDSDENGIHHEVGIWLYSVERARWDSCSLFSDVSTAPLTPLATPSLTPAATPAVGAPPAPTSTGTAALLLTATPDLDSSPAEAVVLADGADLRPGATRWWFPSTTLPAGTPVRLLGYDPGVPDWVYIGTLDGTMKGWVRTADLKISRALQSLPLVTPIPTLTPTSTATLTPSPTPTVACSGEPLWGEAWPIKTMYTADGWMTVIYVRGHGGNCVYTYAWNEEENVVGRAILEGVTFEVHSTERAGNIVGTAVVMSGDETVRVGVFVKPPEN